MEFEKIKEIIKLVDTSSLAFFEIKDGIFYMKMDKSLVRGTSDSNIGKTNSGILNNMVDTIVSTAVQKEECENNIVESQELKIDEKKDSIGDKNLSVISSPMVGTFYSSASPESDPFVQVGDTIAKGKIICIIEAMKLMNEIESEYSGLIVECLVKDGEMVEYGQPLFKIGGMKS